MGFAEEVAPLKKSGEKKKQKKTQASFCPTTAAPERKGIQKKNNKRVREEMRGCRRGAAKKNDEGGWEFVKRKRGHKKT